MTRPACGATLLEVLLSVAVMAALLVPLLGLLSEGVRATRTSLDEVLATSWATDVLEQVQCAAGTLPREACLSTVDGSLRDGAPVPGGRAGRFHLAPLAPDLVATLTLDSPGPGLCRATARVFRRAARAAEAPPLTVRLTTLIEEGA